jgi:hypothetical protein
MSSPRSCVITRRKATLPQRCLPHRSDQVGGVAPAAADVEDAKLAVATGVNHLQARRGADGEPVAVR